VYVVKAGQPFCEKTSGKTDAAGFQGVHRRNSLSSNTRASPPVSDGVITATFDLRRLLRQDSNADIFNTRAAWRRWRADRKRCEETPRESLYSKVVRCSEAVSASPTDPRSRATTAPTARRPQNERHGHKATAATVDPLVGPTDPPHRRQARSAADQPGPQHRPAALTARPSGRGAAGALQTKPN
jgi:hypothetical protein